MTKVFQNKFSCTLSADKKERGNCFPACIASLMDKKSINDVIQIQEYYDSDEWVDILLKWLNDNGYDWYGIKGHSQVKDEFYLVSGKSPRFHDVSHICVYQNGKLYHDPHPDGTGLLTEEYFEVIEPIIN
jgi:hypothetical protein